MTPQLINNWKIEFQGKTYEIDLFFPRKTEEYVINFESLPSRTAWICLCHDWGFMNLYWQILTYEVQQGIPHDFNITSDDLQGQARAVYNTYDNRLNKEFYG